jgi:hypothetical protein
MAMDYIREFDIRLEKEMYYAGETVYGVVILDTVENFKLRGNGPMNIRIFHPATPAAQTFETRDLPGGRTRLIRCSSAGRQHMTSGGEEERGTRLISTRKAGELDRFVPGQQQQLKLLFGSMDPKRRAERWRVFLLGKEANLTFELA